MQHKHHKRNRDRLGSCRQSDRLQAGRQQDDISSRSCCDIFRQGPQEGSRLGWEWETLVQGIYRVTPVYEAKVAKGLWAYPRSRNGGQRSDRLFSLASERAHLRRRYRPTFLLERQVCRYFDPEAHNGPVSSFSTSSEQSRSPCTSRDILNSLWGVPKLGSQEEVRRTFRKFLFQDTSLPKKVWVWFLNLKAIPY